MRGDKPFWQRGGNEQQTEELRTNPQRCGEIFLQPGFPFAKVFSVFFLDGCLVFARRCSGGTDMAGMMLGRLGGFTHLRTFAVPFFLLP